MHGILRRKFLQAGSLGLGAGWFSPAALKAQGGLELSSAGRPASTRVRMVGDGLGLSPSEQGHLLSRLADEGQIDRDSYSNGGTVEKLEEMLRNPETASPRNLLLSISKEILNPEMASFASSLTTLAKKLQRRLKEMKQVPAT